MNMPFLIGILVVAVIVIIWIISTSNRFKILLVKISESSSGIDVALTKRYDTLTKTMDVVRAYAKHETETFEKVIKLRAGMSMAEKNEANHSMDEVAHRINLVAENYPELRSSENFKQLQAAIMDAEDHLQAARRVYNMNVSAFNQKMLVFPDSIIANVAHYTPREFFEADEIKQMDVNIDL